MSSPRPRINCTFISIERRTCGASTWTINRDARFFVLRLYDDSCPVWDTSRLGIMHHRANICNHTKVFFLLIMVINEQDSVDHTALDDWFCVDLHIFRCLQNQNYSSLWTSVITHDNITNCRNENSEVKVFSDEECHFAKTIGKDEYQKLRRTKIAAF